MTSLNENVTTRERVYVTTTTTTSHFDYGGLEVIGDKEYFNGETLSVGINRIFGMDIFNECTPNEQKIIGSNYDLLKLIEGQKIFHVTGLILEFEVIQRRLYQIKNILIRRNLLQVGRWKGTAKRTLGMILYLTKDCTTSDINDYLRDYNEQDLLRMDKQIQRSKKTKTPEEVMEHNIEVRKLSKQAKMDEDPTIQEKAKAFLASDEFDKVKRSLDNINSEGRGHPKYDVRLREVQRYAATIMIKLPDKVIQMITDEYPLLEGIRDVPLLE